jgi:hypothetical protein
MLAMGCAALNAPQRVTAEELVIAENGQTAAVVVVAPNAGKWEKQAALDLAKYMQQMTGAKPALADDAEKIAAAMAGAGPLLIVGQQAIAAEPALQQMLAKAAKPNPTLKADAIAIKRNGNRVCIAGNNDGSHYYAVAELLRRWGCRWYMPGEIGECIPRHSRLTVKTTEYAYGPPFEVRHYWTSWNGDTTGADEFRYRNGMNDVLVPNGHNLGGYTKDLIPPGKTMFNVPIAEDRTAQHVAQQVLPLYAEGKDVQLGMEDGVYESDSPIDKELISLQYDKYFLTQSYTDAFMTFYNKVAEILMAKAPNSKAHIGFLAYSNITLPPVKVKKAARPLVVYLAPIDIDPIHGIGDPKSGPNREYKAMIDGWAKVMDGRVVIYDYDQSMLVWRDIPNPSISATRRNIPYYAKAGILGVDTESRGAYATTWINLYIRSRLLWDPGLDVDAEIAAFYQNFYGAAAKPMAGYWNAIFQAWDETIATEHEYFVAPVIYTPELVATLRSHLAEAEAAAQANQASPDAKRFADRMTLTRLSFNILDNYMAMVHAASAECDYAAAVAAGERALATREQLTSLNGIFTTYKNIGENGYAWFPGEVQQYRELIPLVAGPKGQLVGKLPLEWNFRRDPKDVGVREGWLTEPVDLSWWNSQKDPKSTESRRTNPGKWEKVRSDVYLQGQGIVTEDYLSYTGHGWYQTDIELTPEQVAGNIHLMFPGLFNECWLYINGSEVAHREFKGVWWMNDYRFEWDVATAGKFRPGKNSVVLRINNPHHFGGMFRRPFLYRAQ